MKAIAANTTFEKKHQEDLERIKAFRLLDDDFMCKVFEDKTCVQFLLRIILNRNDLSVREAKTQYVIDNLQGRSVRLDIYAVDRNGCFFNIEIQRNDRGAGCKRARYNSSLLDANITEPGERYENLAETYVIFITENDVLKKGLPIYHIDRRIAETGDLFDDKAHIIYVNSQIRDETELGQLMHDFVCADDRMMHYKVLADRVRYFKEDEKGVAVMCRAMEEMRNEAKEEGIREGRKEGRLQEQLALVDRMLAAGKYSYEEIALLSKFAVEKVAGRKLELAGAGKLEL